MGVHGLWRLIEPSGKPVPVESLENKILAVDVSIWLHQAIKGFQDARGAPAVNAHLLGIFHRVCKLLYFKVKPVFVFDGGVPTLKKETIAKRNKLKYKNLSEADKIQKQLLNTLIKHSAVNKVIAEKAKAAVESTSPTKSNANESENLFKLPEIKIDSNRSSNDEEEDSESSETDSGSPSKHWNLHNIDTKSEHFKLLPADVRHEILTDLKETRKQSSWGRLHELPTESDDFAGFQMRRLLKRQEVQVALEEAEKEMGGHSLSLGELEEILKDQGVITKNSIGARIASDENTRYLYIRNIKQALEKARLDEEKKITSMKKQESAVKEVENDEENEAEKFSETSTKADLELEKDLQKAIVLSLQDQPSSSGYTGRKKIAEYSFLENFKDEDFESDESDEHESPDTLKISKLVAAQNYMIEYSGLNPNEIAKIISNNEGKKSTKRKLKELNDEYIADQVDSKNKILKINLTNTGINLGTEDQKTKVSVVSNTELKKSEVVENSDYLEVISKQNIQCSSNTFKETSGDNFEKLKTSDMIELSKMKADNPEISNAVEVQSDEVTVMSESEESEGDFNEVEDISSKETSSVKHVNVLEIKIETVDYAADDDLFADIFTPKIDEKVEDKTESKPLGDPVAEEPIMNKFDELKMNQIDEPIQLISDTSIKQKVSNEDISGSKELLSKREHINLDEGTRLKLSDEELMKMKESLSKQQLELRNEQGLRERLGTNITDQMYKEAQDLLELFGLPYIVAPMEAEAQCAFLELASLTDGTITDDSDIWLFGGKTVYKNFFNQSKHVLEYRAEDIKHHFKLSREQMILLALLVGSDYTTGLQGVGPVTALEILAAFPSSCTASLTLSHEQLLIGLSEFKSWFTQSKNAARGKNSLRNKLKNVIFTDSFPSVQVVQAYLNPTVDTSEEKFSWSKPDFEGLSDFGRNKFGWSRTKSEEILKPVIKKIKENKYQSNLLNYFKIKHNLNAEEAQKLMSERVKSAVKKIGQDPKEDEDDKNKKEKTKKKSKKIEKCYDENLKGKITPKYKRKKSYSKHIDDIAKKQENSIDMETHDPANKQKKIKIVKKTTKSNLKHIKDKTETHQRNSKNSEIIDSRDKTVLFSDDEFVDVDKLESFLDTVENEAKSTRKNQKSNKRTSRKFKERHIPQSPQLPETNVATSIKNIELNCSSNEKLLNKDNINMQSESHKDFNSIKCIKDKPEDSIASSTSINVEKDFKNTTLEYEVRDNSNMDTFKYVSQLVKEKYVVKKVEKEKIEKANKKLKPECENSTSASVPNFSDKLDDELKLLKKTETLSQKRIEEIKEEAENKLQKEMNKKKLITRKLHRKEIIPQRERDQKNVMRTRLRAIEVFRKSNIDPSRKKGVGYKVRTAKEDAGLSESSSDSDL